MITIDENKCIGCGLCVEDCFTRNIEMVDNKAESGKTRCIECGHCVAVCPSNAIVLENYPRRRDWACFTADSLQEPLHIL